MPEKTAIVILNYRNYEDTILCVQSILSSPNKDYSIFIVDNFSENNSLEKIYEHFTQDTNTYYIDDVKNFDSDSDRDIILIQNNQNSGYANGNNIGLRLAYKLRFRYLMVLNNDTVFYNTDLSNLRNVINTYSDALVAGPLIMKENGKEIDYNCAKRRATYFDFFRLSYFGKWLQSDSWKRHYYYTYPDKNLTDPCSVDLISGSCMYFNAEKMNEIGYFDEGTFLYYEEDILCEKARLAGYKFYFQPKTSLIHLGAKTMKKHSHSAITLKSSYESALYYLTKWRKVSLFNAQLICLSKYLFMKAYLLRKQLFKK